MRILLALSILSSAAFGQTCTFVQAKNSNYAKTVSLTTTGGNTLWAFAESGTASNAPVVFALPNDGRDAFSQIGATATADTTYYDMLSAAQWTAAGIAGGPTVVMFSTSANGAVSTLNALVVELTGACQLMGSGASSSPGAPSLNATVPAGSLIVAGVANQNSSASFTAGGGMAIPTGATFCNSGCETAEYGSPGAIAGISQSGGSYQYSVLLAAAFGGPTSTTVPPVTPPVVTQGSGRNIGGCASPSDMYYNSRVDQLPVNSMSTVRINAAMALGAIRLGPNPEFLLNPANASTPTVPSVQMQWAVSNDEMDSGNYPITQTSLVSNYNWGANGYVVPTVAASPVGGWGGDSHMIILRTDTCFLYEMFVFGANAPPYSAYTGSIINIGDYNLRTAYKTNYPLIDSDGLDNGNASGIPIWPIVLTHDEVFGVGGSSAVPAGVIPPILHGLRMMLQQAVDTPGFQWPATHAAGGNGAVSFFLGDTFRLKASFDLTTCHNGNVGALYPPWFVNVLKGMQTLGLYFADHGMSGLISTDGVAAWGNPNSATSDNYVLAGWLHCVQLSDLEQVDNVPRIISMTSGRVNQNFVVR